MGTGTKATQSKIIKKTEVMLLPDPLSDESRNRGIYVGGMELSVYPLHPSITPLLARVTEVEKTCQMGQSLAD